MSGSHSDPSAAAGLALGGGLSGGPARAPSVRGNAPDSAPGSRPASLRSRGFQDMVRGYRRDVIGARTTGFITLPAEALVFGYVHTRGRGAGQPRYELAVIARMGWLWQRSKGERSTMNFADGVEIEVAEGEFIASIQGVAEVLWTELLRRAVPEAVHEDPEFARLYKRVQGAVERIEAAEAGGRPLLRRLGPARTDVVGKAQDLYGLRWTMAGSVIDEALAKLVSTPVSLVTFTTAQPSLLGTSYVEEWPGMRAGADHQEPSAAGEGAVDVIAVYAPLVLTRERLAAGFTEAAARIGGYARREQARNFWLWQCRRSARRWNESFHVSIGAWQKGDALAEDRRERPCAVPYLVAEIDGVDAEESFYDARLLVGRLKELGVDPARVIVAFSGNRSFHVRLPHSLLGQPVYARAGEVAPVLASFFESLTKDLSGPSGPVIDRLDHNLYSPLHHIRAVGSVHERCPNYRCVAFRGDHFLEFDLDLIDQLSFSYSPFKLPNPDKGEPAPALVQMLADAGVQQQRRRRADYRSRRGSPSADRGIIRRIREGIAPGETFAEEHAGRNKAAFIYALHLLTSGGLSETDAWEELVRWNEEANPVALDLRAELPGVYRSACRAARRPLPSARD